MTEREQSWSDATQGRGRVVVVTRNPVAEALETIAEAAHRPVVLLEEDADGAGVRALAALGLTEADAVVLCDHDAPDAPRLLRDSLASPAAYVAMMASRRRAAGVLDDLRAEGYADRELARLHLPAGLDIGGKTPGEMALSVVSEIVACAHGRGGGAMRDRAEG